MKRYIVWAFLMLIWLIGFSSISLAEEGKWTKRANMPTARWDFSASVVDGKIYAIGGQWHPGHILSTVEEYDPGFSDLGLETKGKFIISWGKIKAKY